MAVGLKPPGTLHPVPGIRIGTARAGIRKKDKRDLAVILCDAGTEAAAVFTTNRFCAAPVTVARAHLTAAAPRALVINTGFANAGTGAPGLEDAHATCLRVAQLVGCAQIEVLPFSTGVIGERLPVDRLNSGLPSALDSAREDGWRDAAEAIMTTDTAPKAASVRTQVGGREVTVTGIAKGAGMIHPNMATMLGFVATDAAISRAALEALVRAAADASFNRVTVDGDTSTNDACVLLATGRAGNVRIERAEGPDYAALAQAVTEVCARLAEMIVRDGEGATKLMRIEVEGGENERECLDCAFTIAHSPLVKTAFFASDPNWGRILAAIGRAGITDLDVGRVGIAINGVQVVRDGGLAPDYTEAAGRAAMAPEEITVRVSLGRGDAAARVLTCDFSHEYVTINAEYRT